MTITFSKATKRQLKARFAIDGPTGAGKTFTALAVGKELGERVVLVDTENGSGQVYSDLHDFDYFRFDPPYDPARLTEVLKAAEAQGYDVVIVDSLSHFWEGEGGTLDIVDAAAQRAQGNSFAGWKVGTPALRHMVDTLRGLGAHVIVTMRSKMEYVLETNDRGKQVPKKVGMAPVMRSGIEFEFDVVADMDLEHRMVISKSRCSVLADQVIQPGRAHDMAKTFKNWLDSGEPIVTREQSVKLSAVFDGIDDPDSRRIAKLTFADAYGKPDHLLASRFDEALAFAEELAGVDPSPSPAPDPGAASTPLPLAAGAPPVLGAEPRATERELAELRGAINKLPPLARNACVDEIRRSFGSAEEMDRPGVAGAIALAKNWPVSDETAHPPRGEPKRMGAKVAAVVAWAIAKDRTLEEVELLADHLYGRRVLLEDIPDEEASSIESLVKDLVAGAIEITNGVVTW